MKLTSLFLSMVIYFVAQKRTSPNFVIITRLKCNILKMNNALSFNSLIVKFLSNLSAQNAKVQLLDKEGLKEKFKWINTDDLELGSFGNDKINFFSVKTC